MNALDKWLQPARQWLDSLEKRERHVVIAGAIMLVVMLAYLAIWDPIVSSYADEQQKYTSQRQLHIWMQQSANEIRNLETSSGGMYARFQNQSISSLADRSAMTSGVKSFIDKIDQGKDGVKITLKNADFDRIITWLADMENKYGIIVSKAKIEKSKTAGAVDADITLERSS